MRLLGKPLLFQLTRTHPSTRAWASSWASEIGEANWKQPADVLRQFPRVGEPFPNEFAFPVAELPIAVLLKIAFPQSIAVIKQLVNREEFHDY